MAITKLLNMKENKGITKGRHLKNAIKYILNEEKTTKGLYVNSNCGCGTDEIYNSMVETKKQFGKAWGRQGYHFIISFLPGEATEEAAYRTAGKFAQEYLQDRYDYIYAVHNDKDHLHAHIIFNSVSYDGYKYHYGKGEWGKNIQPVTDKLCRDQGFSTILMKEGGEGKSYGEWLAEKQGKMTWREAIRTDLDVAIRACGTFRELLAYMRANGYEIREGTSKKHGDYFAIRPPNRPKAFRNYTLGKDYRVPEIIHRLRAEATAKQYVPPPKLKMHRLPMGRSGYKTASIYQLNHFRHYYQARHFYNHIGRQYREDLYRIDDLNRQCCYLLRNGLQSREAVDARLQGLQYQEKELYRHRKRLQGDIDAGQEGAEPSAEQELRRLNEELQKLRAEKRIIRRIEEGDAGQPGPSQQKTYKNSSPRR